MTTSAPLMEALERTWPAASNWPISGIESRPEPSSCRIPRSTPVFELVSAISAPMLLDRDVDVMTAIIAGIDVFKRQPGLMLLWAWIVAVMIAVGAATAFLGLIIAFPVLGHTAWHAYRALVEPAEH